MKKDAGDFMREGPGAFRERFDKDFGKKPANGNGSGNGEPPHREDDGNSPAHLLQRQHNRYRRG
jgi:hypothetical protein